jgi:hypothetical protein
VLFVPNGWLSVVPTTATGLRHPERFHRNGVWFTACWQHREHLAVGGADHGNITGTGVDDEEQVTGR